MKPLTRLPETLAQIDSERTGYVSIDMNNAAPEIAAGEYLWPRLVAGALVVLDDYGFRRDGVAGPHLWQAGTAS